MRKTTRTNTGRFISIKAGEERYSLCRNKLTKTAKDAQAFCKIGRTARIDVEKLDEYFSNVLSKQD